MWDKFDYKKYELYSQSSTFAPGEDEVDSRPSVDMPFDLDIWVNTVGKKRGKKISFALGPVSKTLILTSLKLTNSSNFKG